MSLIDILNTVGRVLLAVLFVIALASTVAGDGEPAGAVKTLEFIVGSGLFVAAFISDALERFEWFQGLSAMLKRLVVGVFVTGIPILATWLLAVVPASVWTTVELFWPALVALIIGWVGSQVYHFAVNKRRA